MPPDCLIQSGGFYMDSAEKKFKNYVKSIGLTATRGLPDYMILKNGEVVGFVEVKRDDLEDGLRKHQIPFMLFCKKHNIPYQIWSPLMLSNHWKTKAKPIFKKFMMGANEEIWNKI